MKNANMLGQCNYALICSWRI